MMAAMNMPSGNKLTLSRAGAQGVWEIFRRISRIPRCSKQEQRIIAWLREFAEKRNLPCRCDELGNTVIELPATAGCEGQSGIVIQSHVDMVCEKTPDSEHDFSTDAIKLVEKDGWVCADRTTLGADDGIGVALALGLAEEKDLAHPKLELLFTVDEETGLTGAGSLKPGFVTGKYLVNLDGENESFIVGCAGGEQTVISLKLESSAVPESYRCYTLQLAGLRGGHSGIDIDKKRANAIRLLAGVVAGLKKSCDLRICSVNGGRAQNAIPRDAKALVCLEPGSYGKLTNALDKIRAGLKKDFAETEPDLKIELNSRAESHCAKAFSDAFADRVTELLLTLPDGVYGFTDKFNGVVETSSNVANVRTDRERGILEIIISQRSFEPARLDEITEKVASTAKRAGAKAVTTGRYPGWRPDVDSALLAGARKVYAELFGTEPQVKVVHAGLECGIIGEKCGPMEMLCVGPTIENPHSPAERVEIGSVDNVREFLLRLIATLGYTKKE